MQVSRCVLTERDSINFSDGLMMQFSVIFVGKKELRHSCVERYASLGTVEYLEVRKGCVGFHNL